MSHLEQFLPVTSVIRSSSFPFQKNAAVIEEELKTTKRKMNLKIQEVREKGDAEWDCRGKSRK